ncbi:COMM domain-containing protein 4 isoform 5-T5 [Alca torda]
MRFRFCGDLDCPDWVLAEISTLAKIVKCPRVAPCPPLAPGTVLTSPLLFSPPAQSSVKLKLICAQVLRDLLGEAMEYDKILKLTSDAKLESGDVKATIAVLGFILSSAAKHNVDGESLSSELQQLGLPKGRGSPSGWSSPAGPGGMAAMLSPPSALPGFGCSSVGGFLVLFLFPTMQSMPVGCAGLTKRSRAPCRTG